MKIILGINANHADSSACIIKSNKLIAAVEEERINRIKHFSGYPIKSIEECLKIANINSTEITDIAFNTKPLSNLIPKGVFFLKNFSPKKNQTTKRFINKINIKKKILENFKLNKKVKFHFIEHHLAHIASAFYPSGFEKSNGLSIDGSGDFVTCAIARCEKNKIKIIKKNFFPHSLGIFYHAMTQFLGYLNYGDEYKMMGLAAYGTPKYFEKIKNNLFDINSNKLIKLNLKFFNHHNINYKYIADENLVIDQIYNEKLDKLFEEELSNEENKNHFLRDLASSVQHVYEFFFNKILTRIISYNFSEKLVFSGGCALNSSANKILTENKSLFQDVYINYAPGDNGGAIGAALVVANKQNKKIDNIKNPYLGRNFSNDEVLQKLNDDIYKDKLNYKFFDQETELNKKVSKLISESNVIGWFQDRMEFGPRALGNRSILADPRNPDMKDIINNKIKRRESFRPFAPVVLKEKQAEWFKSEFFNQYMSSIVNVIENKRNKVPAITHIDGTARIQTVDKSTNMKLTSLINEFYKITKVPILLNTSFNENEPIVAKPEEALDCLLRTNLDFLVMNNYLITKKIT